MSTFSYPCLQSKSLSLVELCQEEECSKQYGKKEQKKEEGKKGKKKRRQEKVIWINNTEGRRK